MFSQLLCSNRKFFRKFLVVVLFFINDIVKLLPCAFPWISPLKAKKEENLPKKFMHSCWKLFTMFSFSSEIAFYVFMFIYVVSACIFSHTAHFLAFWLQWIKNWCNLRMLFNLPSNLRCAWRTCKSLKSNLNDAPENAIHHYFLFELSACIYFFSSSLTLCYVKRKLSKVVYKVKRISFQHIFHRT